jgi:hypothetical protein
MNLKMLHKLFAPFIKICLLLDSILLVMCVNIASHQQINYSI